MKLSQVIALCKTVKSKNSETITEIHRKSKKSELFSGLNRRFKLVNDEDDKRDELLAENPEETKHISETVENMISSFADKMSETWNYELTKDTANTKAMASIVLNPDSENPKVLAKDVPVTFLIYMEKQLNDLNTFISGLPVIDSSHKWTYDAAQNAYVSDKATTTKFKKKNVPILLSAGNEHHPPQSQLVTEDVAVGTWTTEYRSSAISAQDKALYQNNLMTLSKAVKYAREKANSETEVTLSTIGASLISSVFVKQ